MMTCQPCGVDPALATPGASCGAPSSACRQQATLGTPPHSFCVWVIEFALLLQLLRLIYRIMVHVACSTMGYCLDETLEICVTWWLEGGQASCG